MIYRIIFLLAGFLPSVPTLVQAGAYEDLLQAVELDMPETVERLLIRGVDPNTIDNEGSPILVRAIKNESFTVVDVLLEQRNLNLNQPNRHGETALMYAALMGQETLVAKLVKLGAEINQPGWTALHYAASSGHTAICQFLLDHKAQIDALSPNGTTPLMMAARDKKRASVILLIKQGANSTLINAAGFTAADFAARVEDMELSDWLKRRENDYRQAHGMPEAGKRP